MIVTFYSFKGGVGRSMALANVSEILAGLGLKVVLIDWDLEAPGLERYMSDDEQQYHDMLAKPGLMELLLDYKQALARPPAKPESDEAPAAGDYERLGNVLVRRPSSYALPSGRRQKGDVRLISAGARGAAADAQRYAQAVSAFDWSDFYANWAGDMYFEFLRKDLLRSADIVLIDSRTGVTEHGGVCTHLLADLVVLMCAANRMNEEGTRWMADSLSDPKLVQRRGGRPLQLLPIATRIDQTAEKETLAEFRNRFASEFGGRVPTAIERPDAFLLASEIPYLPFYAFRERVAAREDESKRDRKLYQAYATLAEGLIRTGLRAGLLPGFDASAHPSLGTGAAAQPGPLERKRTISIASCSQVSPLGQLVSAELASEFDLVTAPGPESSSVGDASRALERADGFLAVVVAEHQVQRVCAEVTAAARSAATRSEYSNVVVVAPETAAASDRLRAAGATVVQAAADPSDARWIADLKRALRRGATRPASTSGNSPFLGLRPFEELDATVFFGRDQVVAQLLDRIGDLRSAPVRWLRIEGPPGVGKTSIVRAGVIPAVRRGLVRGGPKMWFVASVSGRSQGLTQFLRAIPAASAIRGEERHRLLSELEKSSAAPAAPTKEALDTGALAAFVRGAVGADEALLLVVDDFDDVADPTQADALAALARALESPQAPFYLVTVARPAQPTSPPPLSALQPLALRAPSFTVSKMSEDELMQALLRPARIAGIEFQSGLVERIVSEAGEANYPLPLISQVLRDLSEAREGHLLTNEAFQRMGGLWGVAIRTAERVLDSSSSDTRERMRKMLLGLVAVGDAAPSRRPLPAKLVLSAAGDGDDARRAFRLLVQAHVVMVDEQGVANLAHDLLLTRWTRLAEWIGAERGALRSRTTIELAALAWDTSGRRPELLPTGSLDESRMQGQLVSPVAEAFLQAARLHGQRAQLAGPVLEKAPTRRSSVIARRIALALAAAALVAATAYFWRKSGLHDQALAKAVLGVWPIRARAAEDKLLDGHVDAAIKEWDEASRELHDVLDHVVDLEVARNYVISQYALACLNDLDGRSEESRRSQAEIRGTFERWPALKREKADLRLRGIERSTAERKPDPALLFDDPNRAKGLPESVRKQFQDRSKLWSDQAKQLEK